AGLIALAAGAARTTAAAADAGRRRTCRRTRTSSAAGTGRTWPSTTRRHGADRTVSIAGKTARSVASTVATARLVVVRAVQRTTHLRQRVRIAERPEAVLLLVLVDGDRGVG